MTSCRETLISLDSNAARVKITDYFERGKPGEQKKKEPESRDAEDLEYFSKRGKSSKNLTEIIKNNCLAGLAWQRINKRRQEERRQKARANRRKIRGKEVPELQEEKFVFIGADVCALYPSLDHIETAAITANAVKESNLYFQDIAYDELSIYLSLTIGKDGMTK